MKQIFKNSFILLIFFFIFLFKESIYSLFIKVNNVDEINNVVVSIKEHYYYNEYQKILNELDIDLNDQYSYSYSKILYRDIHDYYNEITILKGENDDIKENSAVINADGLIGSIKKVNKNSSIVNLITHKDSNISIRVNETYGILVYENNELVIKSINSYEFIKIGDIVYTSGIGNLPGYIKIGKISEIEKDDLGIEQKVLVEPFVDFNKINYVAIINGEKS